MKRVEILAEVAQDVDDVVAGIIRAGRDCARLEQRIGDLVEVADVRIDAVVDVDRRAAPLLAPGVIADQAHRQLVVRLKQQLAAGEDAIAVVDRRVIGGVVVETVALYPHRVEPSRDGVAERPGHAARKPPEIVITDGRLAIDFGREPRLLGDDVDQARRRVALRTAQHLDAVDLAELVHADARTRPIDAVDEHGDRAFESGVVADRSDAADARRAVRFRAGRRHQQRRRQLVELANVGGAAVLHLVAADGGDCDRNVLKHLAPPLRRNDDLVFLGLSGRLRCRSHARFLGRRRRGRLGAGVVVLRECGVRNGNERCRQQPSGLADHVFLSPFGH